MAAATKKNVSRDVSRQELLERAEELRRKAKGLLTNDQDNEPEVEGGEQYALETDLSKCDNDMLKRIVNRLERLIEYLVKEFSGVQTKTT